MRIAIPLYDRFTALDAVGPYEVLQRLPGAQITWLASEPGPVGTDLWLGEHGVAETVGAATGVDADTARASIIAGIGGFATGRFTTPEEVATLVALLASDRTDNVTGANYVIDDGLIKTT